MTPLNAALFAVVAVYACFLVVRVKSITARRARAKRVGAHYADHSGVENVHIGRDGNGKNCILIELRDNESTQPKLIPLASEVEALRCTSRSSRRAYRLPST